MSLAGAMPSGPVEIKRRGLMLVLSSPSGAGKTTISRRLLEVEPDGGQLHVGRFRTQRVGLAIELLAEEIEFAADRTALRQ